MDNNLKVLKNILPFLLLLLLLPATVAAQSDTSDIFTYERLWKKYERCNHEQIANANGRLNVLQRKALKDSNELQLFKVVYHRTFLNHYHNNSWNYSHALLYLDSMKSHLHFSNPVYNGLIDYMMADLLSCFRIYTSPKYADLGLTDLHTLDQWSQKEVDSAASRYYEEAFSLMSQDTLLEHSDFDFMYQDTSFYAILPRGKMHMYDIMLMNCLHQGNCPPETKAKLVKQALELHNKPEDLDITIEYELLNAFYKIDDCTEPLDSNRHWRQLMALEAKYGEHPALSYTKGRICYSIATAVPRQTSALYPKALGFFEETLKKTSNKYYRQNSQYYREQIMRPDADAFQWQKDYYPSARLLLPIYHKNIDTLYITTIQTKTFRHAFFNYKNGTYYLNTYNLTGKGCKQIRKEHFDLSHSTPNIYHITDLFLDSLPTGNYVLLFHTEPEWDTANVFLAKSIKVTNVHLAYSKTNYDQYVFTATDRRTGEPLPHILAKYNDSNIKSTDKNGQFNTHYPYNITIRNHKSDRYSTSFHYNSNLYPCLEYTPLSLLYHRSSNIRELVFDREVYRPGQSVQFKYIHIEEGKTVPDRHIMAILVIKNHEDTLRLVSNKFGSVAGSFKLPANQTGNFYIKIYEEGRYVILQWFEVAEYKLPTFTVTLEDCSDEICQGDTLHIRGQVSSLAGAPLPEATVNLTLSYNEQYRTATVFCDGDGSFDYPFVTLKRKDADIPNRNRWSNNQNPNDYVLNVEALATDVNGETQRAEKKYTIPERALNIELEGCQSLDQCVHSALQWQIQVKNVQQEAIPTPVHITVTRLQQPDEYRECAFSTYYIPPTDPLYSPEDYTRYFPEYSFNPKVNDRASWPVLDTVYQDCRYFNEESFLHIPIADWPKGSYQAKVTAFDRHHRAETVVKHFDIFRTDHRVSGRFEPVWVELPDTVALGDSLPVTIGTSIPDAVVLCNVYQGLKKTSTIQVRLDNEYKTIKVPSRKNGHYQMNVSVQVVKNGFFYFDESQTVLTHPPIPEIEPQVLDIQLTHWNSKLEPGAQEHWEVQITDSNRTGATSAELLTWMVDGSIYEISSAPNFQGLPVMFPKFSLTKKQRPISGRLSAVSLDPKESCKDRPYRSTHPMVKIPDSFIQSFSSTPFKTDHTSSAVRTTPGRSVTTALANLDGPSSLDAPITSVRGNRSDGTQTIIDGIRIRESSPTMSYHSPVFGSDKAKNEEIASETARNSSIERAKFTFDKNIRFRKDFKETAFFYPQLETDSLGKVRFDFTLPEQYTRWHFYALAHAEDGRNGWLTRQIQSNRILMIQSNAPRFLREADTMLFQIKITSLCDTDLTGKATVRFFNMADDSPLDILVRRQDSLQEFQCQAHGTQSIGWRLVVPKGVEAVGYRVLAQAAHYGDGEENALPVLPNRALMTETMHFFVPAQQKQAFTFQRFKQADSPTLEHYSYSVEACTNPLWNIMLSLPYLIRYRYECNEQIFSRVYANAIAAHIIRQHPSIGKLCKLWREDTSSHVFLSKLDNNQQFKDILLEESPWWLDAQDERNRRKNIASLYEEEKLERQLAVQLRKLLNRQLTQGGWDWYGNLNFSSFVTNHIVAGCGKLERLGITIPEMHYAMKRAIAAMDKAQLKSYERYCEEKAKLKTAFFPITETDLQYLYARSFFGCDTQWLAQPYVQNLIKMSLKDINSAHYTRRAEMALFLFRVGRKAEAEDIMETLRQQATRSEDLGMYWEPKKSAFAHYYPWYEAPIERHALLMEAFHEISPNPEELAAMKQWLLMQKNQTHWSNTLATTNAVYAILLGETTGLLSPSWTQISVGENMFGAQNSKDSDTENVYLQHTWKRDEIIPDLAEIKVKTDSLRPAYGACYWQYFEDMDKITAASTGLRIDRKVCHIQEDEKGRHIEEVTTEKPIHIGEKIMVRMVISTDRDLEYVHVKDLRAAAFEPVNVHERNERVNNVSYVVSPRDAATNFFFKRLPAGTYVLEYELLATQKGVFSNGAATVECMYAPEYRAQSSGICVRVTE